MWFLVAVVACKKVEPAPPGLDEVLHRIWQQYDDPADDELRAAADDLEIAVDGAELEEPFDGTVTRLSADEAALVGVTDRDPAAAAGVFLVNAFDCDPEKLADILSYPDQSALYEGVYSAYARTFDTPREDWLAGDDDRVDYDIVYTASMLGEDYVATSRGALRRVSSELGPVLMQRSYMPEPGAFAGETNKSMSQDYQLEVYWPAGGHVVHAYGLWRQADFGGGFDMEGEASQRILLNNLLDWDADTAALCTGELP
jgi:hypothetical protein